MTDLALGPLESLSKSLLSQSVLVPVSVDTAALQSASLFARFLDTDIAPQFLGPSRGLRFAVADNRPEAGVCECWNQFRLQPLSAHSSRLTPQYMALPCASTSRFRNVTTQQEVWKAVTPKTGPLLVLRLGWEICLAEGFSGV